MKEILAYNEELTPTRKYEARFFHSALFYPGSDIFNIEVSVSKWGEKGPETLYAGNPDDAENPDDFTEFRKAYIEEDTTTSLIVSLDKEDTKRVSLSAVPKRIRKVMRDMDAFVMISYVEVKKMNEVLTEVQSMIDTGTIDRLNKEQPYDYTPTKREQRAVQNLIDFMTYMTRDWE